MKFTSIRTADRGLVAALVVALVVVLLLAACGGNGEESTTPAAGTQAATPAETPAESPATTPAATEEPGGNGGQVSSGEIDPCALLTKEEVEAAVGTSVTEPEGSVEQQFAECDFNDPDAPDWLIVGVSVFTLEDKDQARDSFELGSGSWETVTGIGDDAYWADALNSLEVLKGRYDISIDVAPTDGKDDLAIAKELAAKVVDRLP